MSKLVIKIFVIALGIFIFSFGLLLLGTSIYGVFKCHNDINLSMEGFMVAMGILSLFFMGFYLIWISYSILILKKITFTSTTISAFIPSFLITIIFSELIKNVWNRPEKGYSFFSKLVLIALFMAVFLASFYFIMNILMNTFQRRDSKS